MSPITRERLVDRQVLRGANAGSQTRFAAPLAAAAGSSPGALQRAHRSGARESGFSVAEIPAGARPRCRGTRLARRSARIAAALVEAATLIGAELGHPFGEALTGGVSDGSWTSHHKLPTLDGLGHIGGLEPGEYIETATIAARCGVVAGLVAALDAGLLRN